jgi:hypothetical protein
MGTRSNGERRTTGGVMSLWQIITNHRHYWGVPHKINNDSEKLVMICYDCGKVRDVKADICPQQ